MNSINFPKMFQGNGTIINKDADSNKSILEWLHLLLGSEVGTMHGDPEFGIRLKRYAFDQNNYILRDILVDEIYTKIVYFCPSIYLERKNIKIISELHTIKVNIVCKNQATFETNMYDLVLYRNEENQ